MIARIIALLVILTATALAQLTPIVGTFKNPDSTAFSGKAVVSFTKSTAQLTCGASQIVPMRTTVSVITAGTMQGISLYATSCLKPALPYHVVVFDRMNQVVYSGQWTVPVSATPIDVSLLDAK